MWQKIKKFFLFKLSKRAFYGWMVVVFISGLGLAYYIYVFDLENPLISFVRTKPETTAPITVESPLNGVKIDSVTAGARPTAVMIENHSLSRPQSGLDKASVVYEAIVEGGITRYMAVFLENQAGEIGPVRSARTYYLDWVLGLGGFYAHAGGSDEALARIITEGVLDLNHDTAHFWRSATRYAPHNLYTSSAQLYDYANKRGYDLKADYDSGNFKGDLALDERPETTTPITINFSSLTYQVIWKYDRNTNEYLRTLAGLPHKDAVSGHQLSAKAIVVQFAPTRLANTNPSKGLLSIDTIGSGKALIFQDGQTIVATWHKDTKASRTRFLDQDGKAIPLTAGVHWFEITKTDTQVSY
jgi:hypothetical protein